MKSGPPTNENDAQLGNVQANIQKVIQTLRAIASDLRPPSLAPFGLERAIRSHAEQVQKSIPAPLLELDLMADGQVVPERIRLALFRIYQVVLTNIIRHAQATKAVVRLILDEKNLTLIVEDDGRGFQVPERWVEMARQGHLGLVGAFERAEAVGGCMEIHSQPGKGTQVLVVVPL